MRDRDCAKTPTLFSGSFPSINRSETYVTTLFPPISLTFEAIWRGGAYLKLLPAFSVSDGL